MPTCSTALSLHASILEIVRDLSEKCICRSPLKWVLTTATDVNWEGGWAELMYFFHPLKQNRIVYYNVIST